MMDLFLLGFFLLLPFQHVVLLPGGIEASRPYAAVLGLAWFAGYLMDGHNRGRVGSLAPLLLAGTVAATAIAVPFGADPAASLVRWLRFVVLWSAFLVAVPSTLRSEQTWRRAALVYVSAGVVFGFLNYADYLLAPVALLREIAASPTRFVIRNALAFQGGAEGHGHEVGHFASFAILFGLGLALTARNRWERLCLLVTIVIASGALLLSFTKSAWAGLGLGLGVLYWSGLRRTPLGVKVARWNWIPAFSILTTAAAFWLVLPPETRAWLLQNFLFRDVSGTQRLLLWSDALGLAADHPLVGVGLNTVRLITGDPHNWWLEMLAEGGLLAFAFAFAFFWRLWRELVTRRSVLGQDMALIRGAAAAVVASIAFQGLFEASFLWDFPTWAALGLATAVAGWPATVTPLGHASSQAPTHAVPER